MRSVRQWIGCLAVAVLSTCGPSWAQTKLNPYRESITDESVHEILKQALTRISSTSCGTGPCAPASDEEFKSPPVAMERAREAVKFGFTAGGAEKCGLDSKQMFFVPMIHYFRESFGMNERQLGLMTIIYEIKHGEVYADFPADFCTPALKNMFSQLSALIKPKD